MPSECLTIENIPYAVALIDKLGVVVDVNKELELLSGFEKKSIQGENIENLFTCHFSQKSFIQQFGQEKQNFLKDAVSFYNIEFKRDFNCLSVPKNKAVTPLRPASTLTGSTSDMNIPPDARIPVRAAIVTLVCW